MFEALEQPPFPDVSRWQLISHLIEWRQLQLHQLNREYSHQILNIFVIVFVTLSFIYLLPPDSDRAALLSDLVTGEL